MKDLIKEIFEEKDKDLNKVRIVDESLNKLSVDWMNLSPLVKILSGKYERIDFERVENMTLGISELSEYSKQNREYIL